MLSHAHRRQVLLFLAAILLPCAALVVLGLRLAIQDQQLARARLDDERRRVTRELHQELSSHLDRTALQLAGAVVARPELLRATRYSDSTIALVARVEDGRLILPWEHDNRREVAYRLLDQGVFAERLRKAERAEFVAAEPARAAQLYREALTAAQDPTQAAHVRLSLARTMGEEGRRGDAVAEYRRLVSADPDIVDEHGIPVAWYAARRLLRAESADTMVLGCLERSLQADRWPPPSALYLLRDLAESLVESAAGSGPERTAKRFALRVSDRLDRTEHALALRRDWSGLGIVPVDATPSSGGDRWVLHGSPAWLVGSARLAGGEQNLVVAVRAHPVLASLRSGMDASSDVVGEILPMEEAPEGAPLGPAFPGLMVRFGSSPGTTTPAVVTARWWLYGAGLALVIGVTLFGAYLLWRDVRREVELAETRSSFVSAVSHELKTPVAAIRMFAETLQMGRPTDEDTRGEYLDMIVDQSERLTRLVNNVLDFSRIEQGRRTYRRESTSLAEVVRSSARAMRYPLEQGRFDLHVEVEKDLPPARVDRDAIEQAILNLLANAMKYSGADRDIGLRLRGENGEAVIEVSDRGVGIEPAEQERIFERFYRATDSGQERASGTGLGLTVVRHTVEAHGGRIAVDSIPGEGSTFSLFIPLEGEEP